MKKNDKLQKTGQQTLQNYSNYNNYSQPQLNYNYYQNPFESLPPKFQQDFNFSPQKKFKTADQIVNEFKSHTLPKLRTYKRSGIQNLIMLQAHIKGAYVRKYLIPRKKQFNKIIENYLNKLIQSHIENSLVPDIVLEILTYNKQNEDVSLYSTQYRCYLQVMDRILNKVLQQQCGLIANEAVDSIVQKFVKQSIENKPAQEKDPMILVTRDIIGLGIKDICQDVAQICVQEITQEYLNEMHIEALIREKYLKNAVEEVCVDAVEESIIESLYDDIIFKTTKELAISLSEYIYRQTQKEYEGNELDKAMDVYLGRQVFDIMLEQCLFIINENEINQDVLEKE